MSTPEQPQVPGLTRKQLREIRMTGATPVVTADMAAEAEGAVDEQADVDASPAETSVPLPRPAAPVAAAPAPTADADVDLGASPLTRRQAREQERIRTASVPVITADVAAAHTQTAEEPEAPVEDVEDSAEPAELVGEQAPAEEPESPAEEPESPSEVAEEPPVSEEPADSLSEPVGEPSVAEEPAPVSAASAVQAAAAPVEGTPGEDESPEESTDTGERPILRPGFGADLGAGPSEPLPPSFDELIARGSTSTGSMATPNALILSQVPSAGSLSSPITATGELLITGTLPLEGLGSRGHAHGTTDGKDVDSVLIDGEIPAASSPTPIAASAAVSTVKGTGEIIRPPAPEKGNKLMLGLAITAGVLAVALVGVLILAFATGVF